jgi:hypothetical protein
MKFKITKEVDGVFYFDAEENGKLVKRGATKAQSKSDAIKFLETKQTNYEKRDVDAEKINEFKEQLLNQVKYEVSALLQATDYKVIRHRDQLDLIAKGEVITTTLSSQEYEDLLKERNALRAKSNELEATINSKRSVNTLEKIKIEY